MILNICNSSKEKRQGREKKSVKTTESSRNKNRSKFLHCQFYKSESRKLQENCKNPQSLQVILNSWHIFLIKAKNPKHLPYPYIFTLWNEACLETCFKSSLQTHRVHLTPLCTLTGRWRDDAELKRCSVVRGNILWTVRWPAILPLHYPGTSNNYDSKREGRWPSGQHQTNYKEGMMEGSLPEFPLTKGLVHNWVKLRMVELFYAEIWISKNV